MSKPTAIPSVSVTYAQDGTSTSANALGMRPMQERAYQKRGEQYLRNFRKLPVARLWADWQRSLSPFVVRQDLIQPTFQVLVAAYSESGRVYHTLDHLQQVLDTIQQLRQEANNLSIVQLAAWFHDAVYQVRATDNEAQSAALAEQLLGNLEVPPGAIAQIQRLILQTQHHQADSPDPDSQVLLDADLAILAAPLQRYQAYAAAIRQEYGWLTDMAFRQGRRPVLQQFLQRDRLFYTETMFQQAETQARTNLQWELRSLSLPPD